MNQQVQWKYVITDLNLHFKLLFLALCIGSKRIQRRYYYSTFPRISRIVNRTQDTSDRPWPESNYIRFSNNPCSRNSRRIRHSSGQASKYNTFVLLPQMLPLYPTKKRSNTTQQYELKKWNTLIEEDMICVWLYCGSTFSCHSTFVRVIRRFSFVQLLSIILPGPHSLWSDTHHSMSSTRMLYHAMTFTNRLAGVSR